MKTPFHVQVASLIFTIMSFASLARAADPPPSNAIVLTTKRMCCAKESVPAMKELYKIPGVGRVVADHKTRSLTIIPKAAGGPSHKAVWEAAVRVNLEPVRLATSTAVYDAKPKR